MIKYLYFKNFYSRRHNLDPLLVSNIFIKKLACYSIVDLVFLHILTEQMRYFSTFDVSKTRVLSLQQGTSRLQTSADLRTFSINIPSSLKIHFNLLNPIESRRYHVICIVLLLGIRV
jgi:hypothetical protein